MLPSPEQAARLREQERETLARAETVVDLLIEKLKSQGFNVEGIINSNMLSGFAMVNGYWLHVKVKPELRSSSRRGVQMYSGKLRMTMQDDLSHIRNYPEPKKGFDIETAAERVASIVRCYDQKAASARNRDIFRTKAENFFQEVCDDLGIENGKILLGGSKETPLRVERHNDRLVKITALVDSIQLRSIISTLCELDVSPGLERKGEGN